MTARRVGRAAFLAVWIAAGLAAGPPEIKRVHVPAAKASSLFPAGSQLRVLSVDEFERLAANALAGARLNRPTTPRLLRADHRARLDGALLTGETSLYFDTAAVTPSSVEIQPWTPALVSTADPQTRVLNTDDGRFFVVLDQSTPNPVRLQWTLRARSGSDGSVFTLGLPRVEISSLRLDLPAGIIPEGSSGIRQGPVISENRGRQLWRIDGASGLIDLRLRKSSMAGVLPRRPTNWVGGRTTIEVEESVANWRGEWTVDLAVGSSRTLFLDIDPGLELIDVQGPAILGFRTEPLGDRSRLTIQLSEEVAASSPITLRALAAVPDEGLWHVPTMEPVEAVWTGGHTSIRIGGARALEKCEDRSGLQVGPTSDERKGRQSSDLWLDFETTGPRSVADLTLRRPREERLADVLSRVQVGRHEMELSAKVVWTVRRGRLLVADVDLPSNWTIERVSSDSKDVAISWLVEPVSGGGTRLVVSPAEAIPAGNSLSVHLIASSKPPTLGSWLELPRVRTPGAIVKDERAILFTDDSTNVRSVDARGLVWLDPESIDVREVGVLAWRWTKADARGRVAFDPRPIPTSATVRENVTIDPKRLRIAAKVKLKLGDGIVRRLRFAFDVPGDAVLEWRLEDDPQGPPLPIRRLESDPSALTSTQPVWELELPHPKRGTLELSAKCDFPWDGIGTIPRPNFEPEYPTSGRIQIDVDRSMRTTLEATGVRVLDSVSGEQNFADVPPIAADSNHRPAHGIAYGGTTGRIHLATEVLTPVHCDGVIREAVLRSRFLTAGATLHQMDLHIIMTGARELGFRMPESLHLQQVRVDGRPSSPFSEGNRLKVPLTPSNSTRPGCVVHLEFTQESPHVASPRMRPILPEFDLPVLSMIWALDKVVDGEVGSTGLLIPMSLSQAGLPRLPSDVERLGPSWSSIRLDTPKASNRESRSVLRKALKALSGMDLTFGELLTRLDAGDRPLIIDRIALSERGITPATLVPGSPSRVSETDDPLAAIGLVSFDARNAWLITTDQERPIPNEPEWLRETTEESWGRSVNAVLAQGSDESDRYRTVARWCMSMENPGDSTPDFTPDDAQSPSCWYATMGLDLSEAGVSVDRSTISTGMAWGVGLALLGLGMWCRRWNIRLRLSALMILVLLLFSGLLLSRGLWNSVVIGTLWGMLACLAWWSAARRKMPGDNTPAVPPSRTASDPNRRFNAAVGLTLFIAMVSWWLIAPYAQGAVETGAETPILAIFAEEPGARPADSRVLLLLSDDARLRELASRLIPAVGESPGLLCSSVEHRLRPAGEGLLEVESRYTLRADTREQRTWTFPLGTARDVRATVDGNEVPILIPPGGEAGRVLVPPGGASLLNLRRILSKEPREENESLVLSVNPCATAVVILESAARDGIPTFPSARGEVHTLAEGSYAADLGPTGRLEVLWNKAAAGERPRPTGSADAVLLWDAEPAGDRVRVRMTLNALRDPSQLRIGLDPRWVVLSTSIPGLIDTSLRGTRERPEWVARMDPPLPEGAMIRFELWRPREPSQAPDADNSPRTLPRIEALDVAAFIGRLGFRRPEGWRGRLRAAAGSDPLTDEEFLKAWGTLPDNRLNLAGAIRYALTPKFPVDVAPNPVRVLMAPDVQLQIQPGRILISATFAVETRNGVTRQIEFTTPAGMIVNRVEAPGLSDWSLPAPGRLLARFDRQALERSTIQIDGILPLNGEPTDSKSSMNEVALPWFDSANSELLGGSLRVQAPASTQIVLRSTNTGGHGADQDHVQSSRGSLVAEIEPDKPRGTLLWKDDSNRVQVLVRAALILNVNSADWLANLRYRGSEGPIERVTFRLPTAWSRDATVTIPGIEFRQEQKIDGDSTLWTLVLARQSWGDLTIRVAASQPLRPDGVMAFPDLLPLGKGKVDTFLALANTTAHPMFAEGSAGVQEIDLTRLGTLPGVPEDVKPRKAFHVLKDGWSLRARLGFPSGTDDALHNPTRVGSADLACVLDGEGNLFGEARFVLDSDSGAFLPVVLPPDAEAIAAQVDRKPIRPLVGKTGTVLIPLGEGRPRQVSFLWKSPVVAGPSAEFALPSLRQQNVPTLVRVIVPKDRTLTPSDSRLQRVSASDREIRLLEWMNREITLSRIPVFNRGAPRDQAELLASLVDFELQARVAERSAEKVGPPGSKNVTSRRTAIAQIASTRASLGEAVHIAGLDPFGKSARARVGLATTDPLPEIPRLVDQASILGIPRLGRTWDFSSARAEGPTPLRFRVQEVQGPVIGRSLDIRTILLLGVFLGFLCLCMLQPKFIDGPSKFRRFLGTLAVLSLSVPLGIGATAVLLVVLTVGRASRMAS